MTLTTNVYGKPATYPSWDSAHAALYREGFKLTEPHPSGKFISRDGLIDARIKYRTDGRYQIDMVA